MSDAVGPRTLAIDVGGTHLKAAVLDEKGALVTARVVTDTPVGSPPDAFVAALVALVAPLGRFDRASVGFPGVVREGRVLTAPNLGNEAWRGFELASVLAGRLEKPVRIANDADLQGLGVIEREGVEMVVTLGTGFGTGLYWHGKLQLHIEVAHLPFRKGETYDEQLGEAARKKVGSRKWNERLRRAILNMRSLTQFDHLYLGGGNARKVALELEPDVSIVSNIAGLTGGIALWRDGVT
jgi:polyphosphate glucokinase